MLKTCCGILLSLYATAIFANEALPARNFRKIIWRFSENSTMLLHNNDVHIDGKGGEHLYFYVDRPKNHPVGYALISFSMLKHGYTNVSQGVMGGQTNIRNHMLTCDYAQHNAHLALNVVFFYIHQFFCNVIKILLF